MQTHSGGKTVKYPFSKLDVFKSISFKLLGTQSCQKS